MRRRTKLTLLVVYLLLAGVNMAFNINRGRWVAAFEPLVVTVAGTLLATLYEVYVPERLRLRMPRWRPRLPEPPAAPPEPAAPPGPMPLIRRAVPGPEDG
jgi:hypothetical protein